MEHNVDILQKIYKIHKVAKVIGSCIYAKQNILILGNSKKYVILTKFAKFKTDYHHKSVNCVIFTDRLHDLKCFERVTH